MNPPEHWSSAFAEFDACDEAVNWARTMPDLGTAWSRCERADWMLWYAARVASVGSVEHRAVVRAACACARKALQYIPAGEDRPRLAIEAAERWADGHATIDEVREAARAAAYAAETAASVYAQAAMCYAAGRTIDAAIDAARAASRAAEADASARAAAADAAASAVVYAAAAAYAATAAADAYAAEADARAAELDIAMANVVRALMPEPPPPPEESR